MSTRHYLFTSESVTEGHPDKICDQISDAILDAFLLKDPSARVAAETSVTTGLVLVSGEISSSCYVDIPGVVREVIRDIGYVGEAGGGFDGNTCAVLTCIDEQSTDIAGGVNQALEKRSHKSDEEIDQIGAGDQGIMFGYACRETDNLMPLPIHIAHRLVQQLAAVRHNGTLKYLRPDGKSQVTIEYVDDKPSRVDAIVISTQHAPIIDGESDNVKIQARIEADLRKYVIAPVFDALNIQPDDNTKYYINPSGRFVIGGPQGDAGTTGRKIIVDTYGGYSRHGGGAFSGKDPTKVDRSAAYAARYVAKNIVAAGLADKCEVQIGYAIGVARPVSININTFGTAQGGITDTQLAKVTEQCFDLRPAAIIRDFEMQHLPQKSGGSFYRKLAAYGHVGRCDINAPWEQTDRIEKVRQAAETLGVSLSALSA